MLKEKPEDFELYREHMRFGKCDCYRNNNDQYLFKPVAFSPEVNGKYLEPRELYNVLIKQWRPSKKEEQDWLVGGGLDELLKMKGPSDGKKEKKVKEKKEGIER